MTVMPIDSVLPELKQNLNERGCAVLVAKPGAGKTTRVPLSLLDLPGLAGKKIVMLEPRRLAARSAAAYMAASLGETVGQTVGYRVRMDTRVGPGTRIEVVTEGILTRMLQSDPALEEIGLVIFDEFHERSLHADVGLALCLQSRELLREDLHVLVMSATLDAAPVAALLGDAPMIECEGRMYPVETRYLPRKPEGRLEELVARAIVRATAEEEGDALVFLPGTGEIRRTQAALSTMKLPEHVQVLPLHGSLPQDAQDRAIAPARPGTRKVVLSTSIAETSLTIEGTRIVIDSGWMRIPRFSPQTGMSRLETVRVSVASADQRRGRAGRLGPGVCYRLWTEQEQAYFVKHGVPEIREADLAPLALELAAWGTPEPEQLRWLDVPPAGAYTQARELLAMFGAIDGKEAITAHGRDMAASGLTPRLAHMVLNAKRLGMGETAIFLAALLNERDVFRGDGPGPASADLRPRMELLLAHRGGDSGGMNGAAGLRADASALRRIVAEAASWRRMFRIEGGSGEVDSASCGLLLALAFPDRIAQSRGDGRYLLSGGRGAALASVQTISASPYLVAAELDDAGTDSRILLAAPVGIKELEAAVPGLFTQQSAVAWDSSVQAVRARFRKKLGAITVSDIPDPKPDEELTAQALLEGIRTEGIRILPWTGAAGKLRERILFMRRHEPNAEPKWPDLSEDAFASDLESWLAPYIRGMRSRSDLEKLNLANVLEASLSYAQRRRLEEEAPTHVVVPSGSRIPVEYDDPSAPILSVRLQELFGMTSTPVIGGGRVPLTMHLLSPARRPVQVTRDLASFWRNAYFEVKKDLKGRYPKHYWPDDPMTAIPTNRVKPRT
ncbi:ATP-dependent helicase HrpB [Paenibacillus ginsengarvi]|uniref:ATP-dependent helicase HrpB n=1 Tax=Paenibacillus ginsengarvi TaxID=400777 RepID=A0A3B0CIT7_9BACL|nr:ATP-dependent helicase HrpB [Paenibacillus ginsengarvi]RKN84219.1 ATP-dependent helicase HrpB [Paenibacillus ginsengarvi]